jgi:cobalamin biosynthesis protein CobD/CbiB
VWLLLALAADLLTYATLERPSGAVLWMGLSAWLAHRIWKGGTTALVVYQGLQMFALVVFATVLLSAQLDQSAATNVTPATVALYALSVWCLMSDALSQHVARRSAFTDQLDQRRPVH